MKDTPVRETPSTPYSRETRIETCPNLEGLDTLKDATNPNARP